MYIVYCIDGFQAVIPQILPGIGVYWYQGPRYLDYTYWYSYYYLLYLLYPRSPAGPPPQESSSLTRGTSIQWVREYTSSGTVGYLEYGQLWLKPTTNYPLLDTYHYYTLFPTRYHSFPLEYGRVVYLQQQGVVGVYLAYGVYQHHSIIPIPTGNPTIPLYLYQWVYSGQQEEQGRVWVQ